MSKTEKKLYRVLRLVGIKRKSIVIAKSIDELYLDELDFKLLVYYFENEFQVDLKEKEIHSLTSLKSLYRFLFKKKHVLSY